LNTAQAPVYIAGIGIVSPLGTGEDATFAALQANSSAVAPLRVFPVQQQPPLPVGQVEDLRGNSNLPRAHRLALIAAKQAMEGNDCSLDAVVVGSTTGGISQTEELLSEKNEDSVLYRHHGLTTVAEEIGEELQCAGELLTVSTACSSGTVAISMACKMLESGQAQWILAGGADSLCLLTYYGFHSLQLVDKKGSRPFDITREGMSVAEGAAFLLLTNQKPNHSHGVLLGSGLSCDAYHGAAPHPEGNGAQAAMQLAMDNAGVGAETIDYINLHGTGTPENDLAESKAVRRLFVSLPPLSSIKGLSGHGLAASGAIEAVVSAICLKHNFLPANCGCEEVDPECGLQPLPDPVEQVTKTILSNSFGFGGNNGCLILSDNLPETENPTAPEQNMSVPLSIVGKACITGAGHTMDSLGRFFTLESMAGTLDIKNIAEQLPARAIRRMKRFSQMALALAAAAKKDSGIEQSPHAVFMGSGWGALSETWDFLDKLQSTNEQFPSPIDFVGSVHNSAAGQIAISHGATGPNITSSGGDYSFEQALLATETFLETKTRYNTAFLLAADEAHPQFIKLLDASSQKANLAADGGGSLYLCRKAIPGKVAIKLTFYGKASETGLKQMVSSLGGKEQIQSGCAMILAGIPAAQETEGEQQLDAFMQATNIDVPVIHYRKFTGEFASASAVAAVMATQLLESGEIPAGKQVLVLGFGKMQTAMQLAIQ
jgi:3-oxoacyl-[acyl-carrier-protein] synthase I